MTYSPGPCEAWEPLDNWCCELPTGGQAVTGNAVQIASEVLFALSGQRFGLCTEKLRPCKEKCLSGVGGSASWSWQGYAYPYPTWINGQWFNLGCGGCTNTCSCTSISQAKLPSPVYDIVEVKLDGAVMVTGSYRVDDNRYLVRIDGGVWPSCQDMNKADTEIDTWSVTARFGENPPTLARAAVGELACQISKALLCDSTCELPSTVQQVVRQGVTITYTDPNLVWGQGRLGLRFCDMLIETYNPDRLRSRSRAYDIDGPKFRRVGT